MAEESIKNKRKIFDLSAISIIACDCLQAVICIFVDLFLVSKILKSPDATMTQNIVRIGLFYVIYNAVMALSYVFCGNILKKINKSIFISSGAVVLTCVVLLIYLLDNKVSEFVPLVALLYGIGFGLYCNGYYNLTSESISSKVQVKFFAVKRILFQATYIIFPITLGLVIDNVNFSFMALIMLVVCVALVIFSFLIRPKKHFDMSFNLVKFHKRLNSDKEKYKPLRLMYWSSFFRGASFDCFTTLITILVITFVGSNTSLGMFQSVFTACSLLTMSFYLIYYRKKRAAHFFVPTIALVSLAVVGILCATNSTTIIVFYAVYTILNVVLMSVSDSRRSSVARTLSLHADILESTAFVGFYLGAGRILSFVVLLVAGVLDGVVGTGDLLFVKIALGYVAFMYVMYGLSLLRVERALVKQDEEFLKEHQGEEIVLGEK